MLLKQDLKGPYQGVSVIFAHLLHTVYITTNHSDNHAAVFETL